MKLKSERKNSVLIITPVGRLDAFEAIGLGKDLDNLVMEDDIYLVLDMANVPYLSSGGIRVLLAVNKKLSRKKGLVFLCSLCEYPVQVLKMAGLDNVFNTCDSVEAALFQISNLKSIQRHQKDLQSLPCYKIKDISFQVFHANDNNATLKIVGSLTKVMHATLEPEDIRRRRFSETEYSIGLGALGGGLDDCFPLLGEMMTIGGTMVWLPTDSNDTPDFLIPQKDTGEVMIHTGLNMALEGQFNDIILVGAVEAGLPITLIDFYEAIFQIARVRQIPHSSLASVAMVSNLDALFSSGVKISPINKFTPTNHGMITDPENIGQWMDVNTEPKHCEQTMVSFGLGLDLTSDLSGLSKASLDNVFYLHPANVGRKKMLLHNHGVVFHNVRWQYVLNLDAEIRRIVREGEFVDMRHLLDTTRFTRAIAGVSYISNIRSE